MHNRKQYIIYPPKYIPGETVWKRVYSRGQAKKCAEKLGFGSEIHEIVRQHQKPYTNWIGCRTANIWDYHE